MKERLTGAIILVVLIVLLVPELLSGPSRAVPVQQAAAPSSSSEEPPLRSYTIDLANESRSAAPSAGTSNGPPQAGGRMQPSTIVEHPAQDPSASQPSALAPAGSSTPASSQTREPPQSAQASSPPPGPQSPPKGPMQETRPAPTVAERPAPEKSAPRYAAAEKRQLAERPGAPERASAGGWVVQLGVFAKQANAERLVRDLQEQGFHTLVSENSSNGRTLWWVRTGPVAERAAAEQLSARLRAAGHVGRVEATR